MYFRIIEKPEGLTFDNLPNGALFIFTEQKDRAAPDGSFRLEEIRVKTQNARNAQEIAYVEIAHGYHRYALNDTKARPVFRMEPIEDRTAADAAVSAVAASLDIEVRAELEPNEARRAVPKKKTAKQREIDGQRADAVAECMARVMQAVTGQRLTGFKYWSESKERVQKAQAEEAEAHAEEARALQERIRAAAAVAVAEK
jgi:hypothetical protein